MFWFIIRRRSHSFLERHAPFSSRFCEIALPAHQKRLTAALKELQQIEMDFLSNGIVIDPDKLRAEADREMVGTPSHYVFSKNEPGPALDLDIEKPEPSFDYSFKILDVGQFAEDNTLPDGLVYQIQLFASVRKATERDLKGLSPVFSRPASGGKTAWSVGVFRTYADALSRLNKVKSLGFKGAVITAFPAFTARTAPPLVTSATSGSELTHSSVQDPPLTKPNEPAHQQRGCS